MTYPMMPQAFSVLPEDFLLLAASFSRTVRHFLSCAKVILAVDSVKIGEEHVAGVAQARAKQEPVVDRKQRFLYLPLKQDEEILAVAVLEGGDPTLFEASVPWLVERGRLVLRELQFVKQMVIDQATGLPNGRHLLHELTDLLDFLKPVQEGERQPQNLILVELYPFVRDAEQSLACLNRAAACLATLVKASPLHHLGQGVFALVWDGLDKEQAEKRADAVLHWLKRENFDQVHIALAPIAHGSEAGQLLDDAWQALGLARKRGPYACCSTKVLSRRESHPLKPLPPEILAELSRVWRDMSRFALLLLRQDQEAEGASFPIPKISLPGHNPIFHVLSAREAYVLLSGIGRDEAQSVSRQIQDMAAKEQAVTFSSGIALYPCKGFRKADMAMNARKALLHTEFFGPNTTTVFDSVSLNISGDIYYNEGDMAAAAVEYRKGLALNPQNVNLLNSMGVCCAQMNHYRQAIRYFAKIFAIDGGNFMALFNLGLAHLNLGEDDEAIQRFEQAFAIDGENFDLILQLGRLYCLTARYEEAVAILSKGEKMGEGGRRDVGQGALERHLGEAYKALGENRQAMICLERASRHNSRDAAALSLLGEIYDLENQGAEIALSLCRQAVKLDDSQWEYWYRLGLVQFRQGDLAAAADSVKHSLALNRRSAEALYLAGEIAEKSEKRGEAARIYRQVLAISSNHRQAAESLKRV